MAIYHLSSQIIGRSGGKSAVASAAYRAGEKLQDQHIGQTFDYTKKQGVDYKEILAPEHSPAWVQDRGRLWNEVEKSEKRINSQLSRELNIALPKELSKDQQIELIRNFAKEQFVAKGMIADLAMHNLAGENPHAHIMLTTREIGPEGLGKKNREWNDREMLKDWRKEWAEQTNQALEKAGVQDRVDHRSLKDQGERNRLPQKHIGAHAHAMERREEHTELGTNFKAIKEINSEIKEYRKDNAVYKQERKQNDEELKAITNAPISEPAQKIVQQPRTLEQVKQEVKSARAEVNKAYEDMSHQIQIVGNLNNKLKNTNSNLETYDRLDGEIGRVEQKLGKINRFSLFQQKDIKSLGKERDLFIKQKQIAFGSDDKEDLKHQIRKLEQRVQPENKKLNELENRFKQSNRKFDQLNTEAKSLEKNNTIGKSRATGQPAHDTIKVLGNSFEKVQQKSKLEGERIKRKLDQKSQEQNPQKGKRKSQGWDMQMGND